MSDAIVAITREVSRSIERCELTHQSREPIDLERARSQHDEYRAVLARVGCHVFQIGEEPELPDSVFVEDAAVVFDEVAVVTRPGAPSRRPELPSVEAAVRQFRDVVRIEAPGTLDGGDVLVSGRTVFVGLSTRTNAAGIEALAELLRPHGYRVVAVEVAGALHLKSVATRAGRGLLVHDPSAVSARAFTDVEPTLDVVAVPEAIGANVLPVGESVLVASDATGTLDLLRSRGLDVVAVENDELRKAEAALTCCSLVFSAG